jgi:hypothetical protein
LQTAYEGGGNITAVGVTGPSGTGKGIQTSATFGDLAFFLGDVSNTTPFVITGNTPVITLRNQPGPWGDTAAELRLHEGTLGGGGDNYTSFQAQTQTTNINYLLPASQGATGSILWNSLGNGTLRWSDNLFLTNNTTTQNTVNLLTQTANYSLVIAPNGTGALLAQVPDGTTVGGNARGTYAVDFQRTRAAADSVAAGTESFIGSGTNNRAAGSRSAVVTGSGNVVSSANSIVGAGANNTITGAEYVFVTAQTSTASGNYGSIVGGFSSTSSSFGAVTLGGQYGVADHHAEVVVSPNRFTTNGDAQQSLVTWLRQTTTGAATELTLTGAAPGAGTRFTVASGVKYTVQLGIIASSTTGDTAWWQLTFGIKNVGGTTALVGSVVTVASASDAGAAAWVVAVTADNTNDSILITVTGAAATTINWVASGHLTKVAS